MSDLQASERIKVEKLLGMKNGYVSDFSNRTFRDFIIEYTGIDIYKPGYEARGESKANRLRNFFEVESNFNTARLIKALADYHKDYKQSTWDGLKKEEHALYRECLRIAEKIESRSSIEDADALEVNDSNLETQLLLQSIKNSIGSDNPTEALDRLHTFLMKYIRGLLTKHDLSFNKDTRLNVLYKTYVDFLKSNGFLASQMSERIIKSLSSILDAYDEVRNNKSFAHDNEILNHEESILIIGQSCGIIKFIQKTEKKIDEKNKSVDTPGKAPFSEDEIEAAGDAWIQLEIDRLRGK
jgi:hypothetical protein